MNIQYPESAMNVAVVVDNAGWVRVYGPEHNGFRPYKFNVMKKNRAAAIQWAREYNDNERERLKMRLRG